MRPGPAPGLFISGDRYARDRPWTARPCDGLLSYSCALQHGLWRQQRDHIYLDSYVTDMETDLMRTERPLSRPALEARQHSRDRRSVSPNTSVRPAFVASSRQRCRSRSSAFPSGSSFFSGSRSTPGTIPATSQLAWLISITTIRVLSCSKAVRDRLKSFGFGMGAPRRFCPATIVPVLSPLPIASTRHAASVIAPAGRPGA